MERRRNSLRIMFVLVGLAYAPIVYGGVEKTLVSWVLFEDTSVQAGSILTFQNGSEFDGIVFGELMTGKWMAGSENWKRSEKNQEKYSDNDAEAGPLIQMAIVYQKDLISIFRDGKPYASYPARNIDLLSKENNFAVFGKRHMGGGGGISGMIEDARIYDRALTLNEIKELVPNESSEIKPMHGGVSKTMHPSKRVGFLIMN